MFIVFMIDIMTHIAYLLKFINKVYFPEENNWKNKKIKTGIKILIFDKIDFVFFAMTNSKINN